MRPKDTYTKGITAQHTSFTYIHIPDPTGPLRAVRRALHVSLASAHARGESPAVLDGPPFDVRGWHALEACAIYLEGPCPPPPLATATAARLLSLPLLLLLLIVPLRPPRLGRGCFDGSRGAAVSHSHVDKLFGEKSIEEGGEGGGFYELGSVAEDVFDLSARINLRVLRNLKRRKAFVSPAPSAGEARRMIWLVK